MDLKGYSKQPLLFAMQMFNTAPSTLHDDDGRIYVSRTDGSYIGRVDMTGDAVRHLMKYGITEQIQATRTDIDKHYTPAQIGFCPSENKWYGLVRAIYGFTIGSECKKGQIHYRPASKQEYIDSMIEFWSDPEHEDVRYDESERKIVWTHSDTTPNKDLRGQECSGRVYLPEQYGRGEWVAETIDDAKQMAIDMVENCS